MRSNTLLKFVCSFCAMLPVAISEAKPPADTKIQKRLEAFVTKDKKSPGIAVGIVDESGRRVFCVGSRRAGETDAIDADTIFEIGSITKVFTATLLEDMVERGEVKLDDTITNYLPASVKAPSRNGKEITLLDLATHTSGLPRLPGNLSTWHIAMHADNPYADYTPKMLYDFLSSYKLKRDIGSKYEYSNLGVGLLGRLLAFKAETNYESLVVERVCKPLKMESTRITLSPELKARLATGHDDSGKPVSLWDLPALEGCGALRSSLNDMMRFLAANMGVDSNPLSNVLAQTHIARRDADFGGKVGLGWHINTDGIVWHNGGTGGFRSYLGFSPATGRGVVVLANSASDVDDLGLYLLGPAKEHNIAQIDQRIYNDYVGKYKLGGATMTISRDGEHFFVRLTGQQNIEIFPESETQFFCKVVDAQLIFGRDQSGAVTQVILHQNGLDQKATRMK